jgi:hypothetical protein
MRYSFEKFGEDKGVYQNTPVGSEFAGELRSLLTASVSQRFSDQYVAFLSRTNGIQIENTVFFDADELLDALVPGCGSVEIGHNGNMSLYIYRSGTDDFAEANFYAPDELFKEFPSLEALFDSVLNEQGVIEDR